MKIIGAAADGKLLIEATRDEVANLLGAYSAYQLKDAGLSENALKPGVEIEVRGAYERLYWLQNRHHEFGHLRDALSRALRETERLQPVFSIIKGEPQDDAA
jgi:hypothetical protein